MSIDSSSGSSSCVIVLVEDEGDISKSFDLLEFLVMLMTLILVIRF